MDEFLKKEKKKKKKEGDIGKQGLIKSCHLFCSNCQFLHFLQVTNPEKIGPQWKELKLNPD